MDGYRRAVESTNTKGKRGRAVKERQRETLHVWHLAGAVRLERVRVGGRFEGTSICIKIQQNLVVAGRKQKYAQAGLQRQLSEVSEVYTV